MTARQPRIGETATSTDYWQHGGSPANPPLWVWKGSHWERINDDKEVRSEANLDGEYTA